MFLGLHSRFIFRFLLALGLLVFLSQLMLIPITTVAQDEVSNSTDKIEINLQQTNDSLRIEYRITQTFNNSGHGIFLTLPLLQDGVHYKYQIESVKRRNDQLVKIPQQDEEHPSVVEYQLEPYDIINEISQLRIRTGKPDRILPLGVNEFNVIIQAYPSSDNQHSFQLINDWQDPVGKITVIQNGIDLCAGQISCSKESVELNLNPDRQPVNLAISTLAYATPYLGILALYYLLIIIIWYFLARDTISGDKKVPEYEPPANIKPWEAQFILFDGAIQFRPIFLSYLLWLAHNKYITITKSSIPQGTTADQDPKQNPDSPSNLKITILKDLPTTIITLPPIFNEAIYCIALYGFEKGLIESKISESSDGEKVFTTISQSVHPYFKQNNIRNRFLYALGVVAIGVVVPIIFVLLTRDSLLLGNSWLTLNFVGWIGAIPGLWWLFSKWGRLTKEGNDIWLKISRYHYYLTKVEQYKLDFSNNPDQGIQHYLTALSYAAAFGILPKLQEYLANNMPNFSETEHVETWYALNGYLSTATFYVPPSDSSGFSDGSSGGGGFDGGGGSW